MGVGAIGSLISLVISTGNKISYFNRSDISDFSILYENEKFSKTILLTDVTHCKDLDWLIVCIKQYHVENAMRSIEHLVGEKTKIAIIQNGIRLKEQLSQLNCPDRILECMIDSPVEQVAPKTYLQLSHPRITVAESDLAQEFQTLFSTARVDIIQVNNFKTHNWCKLIESSALGGILALTGETCSIFKDEAIIKLFEKIATEGILVAKADGADISSHFKSKLIDKILAYPESKGSSMLTDKKLGRQIEIMAKNGAISRLGKIYKIKTPLNDSITLLLRKINGPEY